MRAIKIPADPQQQMAVVEVNGWEQMAAQIGGGCQYIESVNCVLTPDNWIVMVVDEDGLHKETQHHNPRGQMLYPFSPIVGTVLVMQMGDTIEGPDFVDFTDLDTAKRLVEAAVS